MNVQKFRNFVITEFVKSGIHCTLYYMRSIVLLHLSTTLHFYFYKKSSSDSYMFLFLTHTSCMIQPIQLVCDRPMDGRTNERMDSGHTFLKMFQNAM